MEAYPTLISPESGENHKNNAYMKKRIALILTVLAAGLLSVHAGVRLVVTEVGFKPAKPNPGQKLFQIVVHYKNGGDDMMLFKAVRIYVWKDWLGEESRKQFPKGDGINDQGMPRAPGLTWTEAITIRGGAPMKPGKHTAKVEVVAYSSGKCDVDSILSSDSSETTYEVEGDTGSPSQSSAATSDPNAQPVYDPNDDFSKLLRELTEAGGLTQYEVDSDKLSSMLLKSIQARKDLKREGLSVRQYYGVGYYSTPNGVVANVWFGVWNDHSRRMDVIVQTFRLKSNGEWEQSREHPEGAIDARGIEVHKQRIREQIKFCKGGGKFR